MHILEKYPKIKQFVEEEIGKRFPGESFYPITYEPCTYLSDKQNLFKFQVFFRDGGHRAYLAILSEYSAKLVPVVWKEIEYVEEGFKKHEVIPLEYSLTREQILEFYHHWHETFIWQDANDTDMAG